MRVDVCERVNCLIKMWLQTWLYILAAHSADVILTQNWVAFSLPTILVFYTNAITGQTLASLCNILDINHIYSRVHFTVTPPVVANEILRSLRNLIGSSRTPETVGFVRTFCTLIIKYKSSVPCTSCA